MALAISWRGLRRLGEAYDIFAARVTQAGKLHGRAMSVSTGGNAMWAPSIASGSENSLVVWTHWPDGEWSSILGARVDGSGAVLDPEGLLIGSGEDDRVGPRTSPSTGRRTASSASAGDVFSARVGEHGAVLDPSEADLGRTRRRHGTRHRLRRRELSRHDVGLAR